MNQDSMMGEGQALQLFDVLTVTGKRYTTGAKHILDAWHLCPDAWIIDLHKPEASCYTVDSLAD